KWYRCPVTERGALRSTLRVADLLPTGTLGLRARKLRAMLSALGVAIGIASIVAVLGVARSSQSHLLAQIARLGTNLLTVANAQNVSGNELELPATATPMIRQISTVLSVAPPAKLADTNVSPNAPLPTGRTVGLSVRACDASLLTPLDRALLPGRFLDEGAPPLTVLGYEAARRLGINHANGHERV